MEPTMIIVPAIHNEGFDAALVGTRMSSFVTPMGFTFCPYRDGSAQRWNFLNGVLEAYMGGEA